MNTRYLFILLCIPILFLFSIKAAEAIKSPLIHVQNKIEALEDYPVVNEMETKILGKSYPNEDISDRLGRLESTLFGTVSEKTLSDRVDDLTRKITGTNNNIEDDDYQSYAPSSNDESLNNFLNQLEKQLMNQVYPNDTTETRVSRLEKFIFNQSSEDYPMNERLERLSTVVKAQPSNEIYKDMAQLNNSQKIGQGVSLIALILMIIAGLAL